MNAHFRIDKSDQGGVEILRAQWKVLMDTIFDFARKATKAY